MSSVIKILESIGAILPKSHFVGTSGRHFDTYIDTDPISPHPKKVSLISKKFAQKFKDAKIEVVAAPAISGIVFAQWTAHHLSQLTGKEVLAIHTEKTVNNEQLLERGFDKLVQGKRCLVIEDLTTTGGSIKKVITALQQAGAQVVQACVMINREPKNVTSATIGVPFSALAELEVTSYSAKECPLCKRKVPINTTVGHGKEFLEEQRQKRAK